MRLTRAQKEELRAYVMQRTCGEWKRRQPCVQRKTSTKMIGNKHAGCLAAEMILQLIG